MLKGPDYEDDIEARAPIFESFFDELKLLLSDNAEPLNDENAPATESSLRTDVPVFFPEQLPSLHSPSTLKTNKRPNSLTLAPSNPAKVRRKDSEYDNNPHTPDQPMIPKNPAFSGDSIESMDEDNTKRMIGTLTHAALLSLRSDFARISWPRYARNCRLRSSGYFLQFHF
jgi:hypothetical protein